MYLCLWDIDRLFKVHGKSIADQEFAELPQLPDNFRNAEQGEENIDIAHERELGQEMLQLLNNEQRHIYDTLMEAIQTHSENNCFFVVFQFQQEQVKLSCTTRLFITSKD